MAKIKVENRDITILTIDTNDYISLTDIARHKTDDTNAVIGNWMRNRNSIEFLGIWGTRYNSDFKPLEFEGFKIEAGLNAFTLSPTKWKNTTNAVGITVMPGRYGKTHAHKDIAFKVASWISVEFQQMTILQEVESRQLLKQAGSSCPHFPLTSQHEQTPMNQHIF